MSEAVLVTGGSGFIGTWVLKAALQQGLRPVVLDVQPNPGRWNTILGTDSERVSFVAGDLCDLALLRKIADEHRVSRIIHLAALLTPQCQTDPLLGCRVNVMGSTALFELARSCSGQIRGISYASSYAVYGPEADDPDSGTRAEDNRPPSFYGAFKLAVDLIAEQYWRHFQIASVGIRPHVVYGPERTVGLTAAPSLAAKAAARNESFAINYTARLSYDYVEDVASAFVRAAVETPPGSVVLDLPGNVATSEEFAQTIMQVVPESVGRISVSGNPIPSNIPPQPSYFTQRYPDWQPCTLAAGIRRTVDFYRTDHQ